jgi:hypothetical protein
VSGYATLRPRHELLEVLASIAAYQDAQFAAGKSAMNIRWGRAGAWAIVRQGEIIYWYERLLRRFGVPIATICRRTLNYQLAGLVRDRFLTREQRHIAARKPRGTRKLDFRPSLYKFTTLGRLWIKRRGYVAASALAPSRVQTLAQSGFNSEGESSTSLLNAVGKASTQSDRVPPKGGGKEPPKTAALRARTRSSTHRAVLPTAKRSAGKNRKTRAGARATASRRPRAPVSAGRRDRARGAGPGSTRGRGSDPRRRRRAARRR